MFLFATFEADGKTIWSGRCWHSGGQFSSLITGRAFEGIADDFQKVFHPLGISFHYFDRVWDDFIFIHRFDTGVPFPYG